jgi:hypothetical protein
MQVSPSTTITDQGEKGVFYPDQKNQEKKILVYNKSMGCISSSPPMTPSESKPGLNRQVTITLTSPDNDDIVIVKHGEFYIIQGTKAVVDVMACRIIGYLDDQDVFHKEHTEYVKEMCTKYEMVYL